MQRESARVKSPATTVRQATFLKNMEGFEIDVDEIKWENLAWKRLRRFERGNRSTNCCGCGARDCYLSGSQHTNMPTAVETFAIDHFVPFQHRGNSLNS
jgi:hypothetical protein